MKKLKRVGNSLGFVSGTDKGHDYVIVENVKYGAADENN